MATVALRCGKGTTGEEEVTLVTVKCRAIGLPRRAWVTLLSTDSYLRGVQCLARALLAVRSRYPLVVMMTGSVSASTVEALTAEGCEVRAVEYVRVPSEAGARYACAHFADCWSKLSAWAWVEYEQLCYLDADMLPLTNMDELLEHELPPGVPLLAVPECACRQAAMRPHCPYGPPLRPSGGSSGATCREVRRYFNAGLLVFRPSLAEHAALLSAMRAADVSAFPFAEQDLLNRHYASAWLPLSAHYNCTKAVWVHHRTRRQAPAGDGSEHAQLLADEPPLGFELELSAVRNLHFTMAKPWQLRDPLNRPFRELNQRWWATFMRGSGALHKVCMVLAIRAKAAGAKAPAGSQHDRRGHDSAPGSGPALPGLSSSDSDSDDADAAGEGQARAGAGAADASGPASEAARAAEAEMAAAVVASERWCLVVDEPPGHLAHCRRFEGV